MVAIIYQMLKLLWALLNPLSVLSHFTLIPTLYGPTNITLTSPDEENKRSSQGWNSKILYRFFLRDQALKILKFTEFI